MPGRTLITVRAAGRLAGGAALAAAVLLAAAGCGGREPTGTPARPDVILVVVDALRADHLSHYGYDLPTAAPLDAFRDEAALFQDAWAPAPWTGPSVASLFTGLFTARHRVNTHGAKLGDEALTMAEILRGAGWQTAAHVLNAELTDTTGYSQGFDEYRGVEGKVVAYPDAETVVEGVRERLAAPSERPLFLYLHLMNVHGPYRVPEAHRADLLGRPPLGGFRYYGERMNRIMRRGRTDLRASLPEAWIRSLTEQYDTAVRYSTGRVAAVFELLRESGRWDDSLVILVSDHGEELFDHGGFSHGYSLHREVLHVPLYVKLPRGRTGTVVKERVTLMDLLPTILEAAGIEVPPGLDGRSLLPLLRSGEAGGGTETPPAMYHQVSWERRCVARAVVDGGYKLVDVASNYEGLENVRLLYDLRNDPAERLDLAGIETDRVARMRRQLDEAFDGFGRRALAEPENVLDRMDQERLRSLGYIGE